jgi:hypothetical protein
MSSKFPARGWDFEPNNDSCVTCHYPEEDRLEFVYSTIHGGHVMQGGCQEALDSIRCMRRQRFCAFVDGNWVQLSAYNNLIVLYAVQARKSVTVRFAINPVVPRDQQERVDGVFSPCISVDGLVKTNVLVGEIKTANGRCFKVSNLSFG